MQVIADLHIHSKYSRATSQAMDSKELTKFAKVKGIDLLGSGDFTHPTYLKELKNDLKEIDNTGIFKTENNEGNETKFVLSAEVSLIYYYQNKLRKIHNVLVAPNFEIVEQINEYLSKRGNLEADGRPTFGKLTCPELAEALMEISKEIMIIPAHIWTPWFSIFGDMSGFDSVEECFRDQTKNIFALETGMSSDPAMNWRLSKLDNFTLVSNSDSHSPWPWRLGRECNVFALEKLTYQEIFKAIKNKDTKKFLYTIEVDPNYGKYHYDGHRNCNVCMSPKDAIKNNNICPGCKRKLTIGVLHRVEELADREEGFRPPNQPDFKTLIPLGEIMASVFNTGLGTKKVWEESNKLIKEFGNELNVLLNIDKKELEKITHEKIAEAIIKSRNREIKINPGYDGEYGKLVINENEKEEIKKLNTSNQKALGDFV